MRKKMILLATVFALISMNSPQIKTVQVALAEEEITSSMENSQEISFTNEEFFMAAQQAYEDGAISKSDYDFINTQMTQRIGIRGENKLVENDDGTIDIYLNNVVATTIIGGAVAAGAYIIAQVPAIGAWLSNAGIATSAFSGAIGGAIGAITNADDGIIINLSTDPLAFYSVRDQ